jgi:hypothetical protein
VTCVPTGENNSDDLDEAHDIMLETAAERNKGETKVGNVGALSTEDECRCHLVEWTSESHKCAEPILLTEHDPPKLS